MDFDESLLEKVLTSNVTWLVDVQGKQFVPSHVDIAKSMIPVKKPSTRGGVYFSETEAYKVQCSITDVSIASVLTSTMLGPNTDFIPIKIIATILDSKYVITANLTNYVQTKNDIQLNLVVVDVTV